MNTQEQTWQNMYTYWESLQVPEFKTRKFVFERDFNSPWYSNVENGQVFYNSNPINSTAKRILLCQKDKALEFVAAFKIYTYERSFFNNRLLHDTLFYAFQKHNEEMYNWWYTNAKYIFPTIEGFNEHYHLREKLKEKDWKRLIELAAQFWTLFAEQFEIIIIPELMEVSSAEYIEYRALQDKKHDETEYQSYLRLKAKFEK